MAMVGVLLGMVGTDVNSGVARYTMNLPFLMDGIGLISIALGCFGIAEVVKNLDNKNVLTPFNGKIKLMPTWPEFKRIIPSALRGSVIGSILGILPGGGPTIAQFAAYAADKTFSKYKHEIGTGCIEGVAGQAAADEAAARTSFIPLMAIGIPENAVMALMMAAFVVKGIQPGPNMIATHPDLFWGLVASMWVGNCFLVILNVPLVRYWLSVFKIPYTVLFPAILFFCCIGTFSINNSLDDIYTTAVFGLVGYLFLRLDMEAAPLLLGFILGPMLEENFRRAMLLSRGSFSVFVTRPISGTLLGVIGIAGGLAGGGVCAQADQVARPSHPHGRPWHCAPRILCCNGNARTPGFG
jgi:putative tricarboxylic transport membrane protein